MPLPVPRSAHPQAYQLICGCSAESAHDHTNGWCSAPAGSGEANRCETNPSALHEVRFTTRVSRGVCRCWYARREGGWVADLATCTFGADTLLHARRGGRESLAPTPVAPCLICVQVRCCADSEPPSTGLLKWKKWNDCDVRGYSCLLAEPHAATTLIRG